MWGEVTPAERLRAVTRRSVDEDRLAIEAADALAGFASEPASLVVACRRVLAHHRVVRPAVVGVLADPRRGRPGDGRARGVPRSSRPIAPPTGSARRLPLLDEDQVVAVVGWPDAVDLALLERLDVAAVALRVDGADPAPRAAAPRRANAACASSTRGIRCSTDVPRFLVAAAAIGPEQCLVPAGTADALDTLGTAVARGVGGRRRRARAARPALRRRAPGDVRGRRRASATTSPPVEELPIARVDCIAGPRGVQRATDAAVALRLPGRAGAAAPARLSRVARRGARYTSMMSPRAGPGPSR